MITIEFMLLFISKIVKEMQVSLSVSVRYLIEKVKALHQGAISNI